MSTGFYKALSFAGAFYLLAVVISPTLAAEDTKAGDDPMMKAVAMDAGHVTPTDQKLFAESIRSTKQSIARETLDVFYRDAVDYYRQGRYDESLEWLEKIYSIDPYYEDVGSLRETIRRLKTNSDVESKRAILEDYMRKGNMAQQAGQNVQALSYWKQALTVNGSYEPALKKIRQVNKQLAQKQYEAGYLYYHHGDMEQALDSWSNAIALDPSYKQRGLLQLMSKIELSLRRDRITKLASQAAQQYAQKDLPAALQTYEDLLNLDPRNEEARRMSAKIKLQLGMVAYKAARDAVSKQLYAEGIKRYQDAIRYGYEVQRSQHGIQEAERLVRAERETPPSPPSRPAEKRPDATGAAENTPAPVAVPVQRANPEEADAHYRLGLAAIRGKDYHRAIEELEIAAQLNPGDEHIYVAKERAKQEWNAMQSRDTAP